MPIYLAPFHAIASLGITVYPIIKPLKNRLERDKQMLLTCMAVASLAFPFFGISGILASLSVFSGYSLIKDRAYFYHPSFRERELTEQEKDKVKSLKGNPNLIGISWAYNVNKSIWDPVYILKGVYIPYGGTERILLNAYSFEDQHIGHGELIEYYDPITLEKDGYKQKPYCSLDSLYTTTYQHDVNKKYKYIGYLLVKAAEEITRSKCGGRISLMANEISVPFYEKLGFEIEHINSNRLPQMILPESVTKKWSSYSPFLSVETCLEKYK